MQKELDMFAETKMGAFLLLAVLLQSSAGCIAREILLEYDEHSKNFSIIYEENSDEFFQYEDYYYGNSTYDYENDTRAYAMPTDRNHVQNFPSSADVLRPWHNLFLIFCLLPLLRFLQPACRMGF